VTRRLEHGFAEFEAWRDALLSQEESERHKLDRKIASEEDWIRYGVSGRRKRNQGRLARLNALRKGRREQLKAAGTVKMTTTEGEGGGTRVIDAKRISKHWSDKLVVRDFSIRIHRGDRVGVVGANGAGKTTLVNLITGILAAETGNVKIGANIVIARLDQNRAMLEPEDTLANVLTGGSSEFVSVGGETRHVASYMKDFLFTPQQARTPVRVLSGGEHARLLLAKALARPSNLLVLDEPTNDLDLETLDLLEEMIDDYPGTAIIVSHDRDFLDRVATSVLVTEGDGRFVEYAGGYSDMLTQRGRTVAPGAAEKPAKPRGPTVRPRADVPTRKMNFSDRHALEQLPHHLAQLEKRMAGLQQELSLPSLYSDDPKKFTELSQALADAQHDHAVSEERWLELALLSEQLERG
jgi:ATP-binding cassette subfamily F protein uup